MAVTKKIKHKNTEGEIVEIDIGVDAKNVAEDDGHCFVTAKEKGNLKAQSICAVLTVPASGWSGEAPYTQSVALEGVTAADRLVIGFQDDEAAENDDAKLAEKAYGCVTSAESTAGAVVFRCRYKKPGNDFKVLAMGVMKNG